MGEEPLDGSQAKKGRRCCGLPLWGFLLLMVALLVVIAAAIVVPLELFVIQKQNNASTTAAVSPLSTCQSQLTCENGGTNVVSDGVCSCICSNGFTGSACTQSSTQGCTTTTLSSNGSAVINATLGDAIPRLILEGQTNFSLPLSGTAILSKFNSANLSCVAENALVTFNGESSSAENTTNIADSTLDVAAAPRALKDDNAVPVTISITPGVSVTITVDSPAATGDFSVVISTLTEPLTTSGESSSLTSRTTTPDADTSSAEAATTTADSTSQASGTMATSTSSTAAETSTFTVTDEVLDFARVGVLYILQSDSLSDATTAQSSLQKFFSTNGTTIDQAKSLSVGGGNTVDLVNFLINP